MTESMQPCRVAVFNNVPIVCQYVGDVPLACVASIATARFMRLVFCCLFTVGKRAVASSSFLTLWLLCGSLAPIWLSGFSLWFAGSSLALWFIFWCMSLPWLSCSSVDPRLRFDSLTSLCFSGSYMALLLLSGFLFLLSLHGSFMAPVAHSKKISNGRAQG